MLESPLANHRMKVEQRDGWEADYGDSMRPINVSWLVCSCTWDAQLDRHSTIGSNERLLRQEHLMQVAVANSCSDCQPGRPCAEHCPRTRGHDGLEGFCSGCGQKFREA